MSGTDHFGSCIVYIVQGDGADIMTRLGGHSAPVSRVSAP